jgi:hypothetical protein
MILPILDENNLAKVCGQEKLEELNLRKANSRKRYL